MMHLSQLPIIVNKQSDSTRRAKMYECICENVTYNSFHNIKTEMFDNMLFKGAKSETVYLLSICYLLNLRNQYRLSSLFFKIAHCFKKCYIFISENIKMSHIILSPPMDCSLFQRYYYALFIFILLTLSRVVLIKYVIWKYLN